MLRVCEIFESIQGESSYAGRRSAFVRLAGCNLRCTYCDTRYAYHEGKDLSVGEVVSAVRRFGCSLIVVTGGEPLIQAETPELITILSDIGCTVLLETNGSLDISCVDPRCVRIVDFKCPSSGESERNDFRNIERLRPQDEVKFVMGDRRDYDFGKEVSQWVGDSCGPENEILFSPIYGVLDPQILVRWMMDDCLDVRLNLQLHKYIWEPDRRGV